MSSIEQEEDDDIMDECVVDDQYVAGLFLRVVGVSCSPPLCRRLSISTAQSLKSDGIGSPTSTPKVQFIPFSTDVSIKAVDKE